MFTKKKSVNQDYPSSVRTIFFGTHTFATVILQALLDAPNISVDLVITQPDKPVGRKKILTPPPVKLLAEKYNINVNQPKSLAHYALPITPDIGISAQYGLLIKPHILNTPTFGILNVHTSLLPKYRGASPIQSALINGETETGVTIMKMESGLDTGPILSQEKLAIDPDDTYLDLDTKLAPLGASALLSAISPYLSGDLVPVKQRDEDATFCKQFDRDDGRVNWQQTARQIYNQYRGLTPWPGIFTMWNGKRLKLITIKPTQKELPAGKVAVESGTLYIGCASHAIEIIELQLEGKNVIGVKTFLNGFQNMNGQLLV